MASSLSRRVLVNLIERADAIPADTKVLETSPRVHRALANEVRVASFRGAVELRLISIPLYAIDAITEDVLIAFSEDRRILATIAVDMSPEITEAPRHG